MATLTILMAISFCPPGLLPENSNFSILLLSAYDQLRSSASGDDLKTKLQLSHWALKPIKNGAVTKPDTLSSPFLAGNNSNFARLFTSSKVKNGVADCSAIDKGLFLLLVDEERCPLTGGERDRTILVVMLLFFRP